MAYKITWTENAGFDFQQILTYLSENWPQSVVDDFVETCNRKIELLEIVPHIGVASRVNPSVRKLLITKHNALYYSVIGNEVTPSIFLTPGRIRRRIPFSKLWALPH